MLPYLVPRAHWPAVLLLLAACSYDASGLVSAGATTTGTTSSTGDTTSTTAPTTSPPTSMGPDGSASDSVTGTTSPVDPSTSTGTSTSTTTGPDLTTSTTDPGTSTSTTGSTTDPGTSTSTSTTDPGTSTSTTGDSTSTGGSSSGGSSSTGGAVCEDPGPEPNETEATAVGLPDEGCKAEPKNFAGVLDGDADVDWFRYHGVFSGMGCGMNDPDPVAAVVLTASDTVRICVYADCDINGPTLFTCPMGTTMSMSPDGRGGCCGAGSMNFTVNCQDGPNESAQVYVRLDQAPADACVDYDVDYSYHN